jgi:O-antigen ligase
MKLVGSVILALIVLTDVKPGEAVRTMLRRWVYILVPFSVLLIKYYPDIGKYYRTTDGAVQYIGVATHKNSLGAICLIGGIILLSSYLVREKASSLSKEIRISNMAVVLMTAWLFVKANSATALVAFGLSAFAMVVSQAMTYRRNPKRISRLTLLGCLSAGFLVPMIGSAASLVSGVGRDATLTGRTAIWDLVLSTNTNPLLGAGYDSFWLGPRVQMFWDKYSFHINQSHNGYIEIYLNLGLIGLVLFVGLLLVAYRNVNINLLRDYDSGVLWLALFLVVALTNITEAGVRGTSLIWFVFLIVSIAYRSRNDSPSRTQSYGFASVP